MFIQPEGLTRGTHQFQTIHSNRFFLSIDDDPLTKLLCKRATRPSVDFDELEIAHVNKYRYEIGRPRYQPLQVTLNDYVVPSTSQYVSAWLATQAEIYTGRMGYPAFFRRKVVMEVLGPTMDVVQRWDYLNCTITSADFGEMNWESETPMEINLTIRFDDVIHRF